MLLTKVGYMSFGQPAKFLLPSLSACHGSSFMRHLFNILGLHISKYYEQIFCLFCNWFYNTLKTLRADSSPTFALISIVY